MSEPLMSKYKPTSDEFVRVGSTVSGIYTDRLVAGFPLSDCTDTFTVTGWGENKEITNRGEPFYSELGEAALGACNGEVFFYETLEGIESFKIETISNT